MDRILIAPSTDPAKSKEDLLKYVQEIQDYADFLHCDVMDGKFVERKTISYDTISLLKQHCLLPLDVHLMVQDPMVVIDEFARSGANIITIHYESFLDKKEVVKALKKIKQQGCLVGISIKPKTSVIEIVDVLDYVDLVLVMSVEPGKSGQSFIEESLSKICELANIRTKKSLNFLIEVDGGVNLNNSSSIIKSGADVLVSGNCVYSATDRKDVIKKLRNEQ